MIVGLFPLAGALLHSGHLLALQEAKKHCDKLVVALNVHPDGKNPVESTYERFVRLKSCRFVDDIIPYEGENDLLTICQTFDYDIRFIGSDHQSWTGDKIEAERSISFHHIKRMAGISSTDLKKRIKEHE